MGGIASAFFDLVIRGRIYEKLIRRKPSMLYYRNLCVPCSVRNHKEDLKEEVSKGVRGCALSSSLLLPGSMPDCFGISCDKCICTSEHRDTLKEYLGMKESNIATKEQIKKLLKPGMVLCTREGAFSLWVGGPRDEVYCLERIDWRIEITECVPFEEYDKVDAVYAHPNSASPAVCVSSLVDLMRGKDCPIVCCVWKRPEPVKEMTVDEISKALGYKVKVVGNEKTDD